MWQGVRSFQFDVHYIDALTPDGQVTSTGLRVCQSVTSQVDVGALCSGSLNTALGINLNEDTCRSVGVYPEYGIHAGCPPDSPFLADVLNSFDLWVAEGNPAAVTIRFKDFTTEGFVPEWTEDFVQEELNNVIRESLGRTLYTPEEGMDYSDISNWPSFSDLVGSGNRVLIFSNSTASPFVFNDALLDEQDFVGATRRANVLAKRQTQPFFDYTIDVAERIRIQNVVITESGTPLLATEVPSVLSSFRLPSIQRLTYDHLDNLVWGFEEAFDSDDDRACVIIDPSRSFRWYRSSCNENYRVACSVPSDSTSFTFGEVTVNDYETTDVNSYCTAPSLHSAPASPFQQQSFIADANAAGITGPIYVNLRFTTQAENERECGCDTGCWFSPESGIAGLPSTSFCVVPQIEIVSPDDTEVLRDDDDDDLTAGEIAAVVISTVFFVFLVVLLLLFLMLSKGGSNEVTGRVGVVQEEEDDDPMYKAGRGPLTTADTKAATNIEYPDHGVDLDAQVDLGQEEEEKGPANKRKIGALEVSSQSMRDYRNGLEEKK